jgi:hypothetical protein
MLTRDILNSWAALNIRAVQQNWPTIRIAIMRMTEAAFDRDFYSVARSVAAIPGNAPSLPIPGLNPEIVVKTLDSTGPGTLLHDIKLRNPVVGAMQHAGVNLSGAAARLALQGGRTGVIESVQADPRALGWARITASHPCYFCAMLASRGAVYKTQQGAGFQAHNHCMCVASPVFRKEDVQSLVSGQLQADWRRVTKGYSGKEAIRVWRRYWDNRTGG